MKKIVFLTLLSSIIISSCVSPRKLADEKDRRVKCEEENKTLTATNKQLKETNNELTAKNEDLSKQNKLLSKDTTVMGKAYRRLIVQYDKINTLNDELLAKMQAKNAMTDAEARRLLAKLQLLQEDLQKREDALKLAKFKLVTDKNHLDSLNIALQQKQEALSKTSARVAELERMIAAKDSALTAFKNRLKEALLGFNGKGLTITQKNGKVYVSLSEKLLFKSGAWKVDPKGAQALKQLADVLAKNPDINVMIEGHTDNIPYKGSNGISDNWDLSAKRSTSIVKILLKNKELDASRIIAAGRGEFVPLADNKTKEGRSKNRRTEIILTPKWDEIFKVLDK